MTKICVRSQNSSAPNKGMRSSASFNSLTTIREHFRRSSLLRSDCSRESMQNDTWGDEKGSTKKDSRQVLQGNPFELIRPPESTLRKRTNSIQEDDLGSGTNLPSENRDRAT